ncbi:hypothetical protein OpiT1DRAFT_02116 [Opitutaceae bacterium TAV1]|nr:hypothetical protein OpiT1DRAFT_02116 [Opitutaceae bacterium TAV1]
MKSFLRGVFFCVFCGYTGLSFHPALPSTNDTSRSSSTMDVIMT